MTKLEAVLERIRQLPPERQEAMAVEMEFFLEQEGDSLLSDAQWAEVQAELNDPNPDLIPHEQIVAEFEKKFGR